MTGVVEVDQHDLTVKLTYLLYARFVELPNTDTRLQRLTMLDQGHNAKLVSDLYGRRDVLTTLRRFKTHAPTWLYLDQRQWHDTQRDTVTRFLAACDAIWMCLPEMWDPPAPDASEPALSVRYVLARLEVSVLFGEVMPNVVDKQNETVNRGFWSLTHLMVMVERFPNLLFDFWQTTGATIVLNAQPSSLEVFLRAILDLETATSALFMPQT